MNIEKIKRISLNKIVVNKIYLYSAGFNVDRKLNNKSRINEELKDLKILLKKKVKIGLVSHQGSYKKKDTIHLDFLINYLEKELNTKLIYLKKMNFKKSIFKKIKAGEILLLPNIRFNKGEEANCKILGKNLSKLADFVIIGGFSKAHRKNSSNNSILNYIPGYLSNGIYNELIKIKPWIKPNKNSVCIIGGEKKEKITTGLKYLIKNYRYVIPCGVVLNSFLKFLNYNVGQSKTHELHEIKILGKIIKKYKKKLILPDNCIVTLKKNFKIKRLSKFNQIQRNELIAGFKLNSRMKNILKKCISNKGYILLAGTPSLVNNNFNDPSFEILKYLKKNKTRSLLLGGDTISDLSYDGIKSSGGGSALHYLSNKPLPIITGLYKNQKKFNVI